MSEFTVLCGDSIELLKHLPENSIDSIVMDPPYGLSDIKEKHVRAALAAWLAGETYTKKGKGFMGKDWDAFVPGPELFKECFRVLKPGGHMACFAGSRTADLMGISIRLAGFEIRDTLQWLYGSGFPKSLDVSKAIDKEKGAERRVVGHRTLTGNAAQTLKEKGGTYLSGTDSTGVAPKEVPITSAGSPEGEQWEGWGTALKPAHEPIILARKPLEGTVALNVLEYGTGGLNVDGCRVGDEPRHNVAAANKSGGASYQMSVTGMPEIEGRDCVGRWPANIILDAEAGAMLDAQVGNRPGMSGGGKHGPNAHQGMFGAIDSEHTARGDNGGPSRFFYCPKTSKKEREAGLENWEETRRTDGRDAECDNPWLRTAPRRNTHPTVKPQALMAWLCRLVTPPGGVILDPTCGSGSTGCAAVSEGFEFLGIDMDEEYCEIARARIKFACTPPKD